MQRFIQGMWADQKKVHHKQMKKKSHHKQMKKKVHHKQWTVLLQALRLTSGLTAAALLLLSSVVALPQRLVAAALL